jgi:hypothetical protein
MFMCGSLCSCAVRRDLADILCVLADVAMVSSPLLGRGYQYQWLATNQPVEFLSRGSAANQSTGRVSLPGLGIVVVGYQMK